MCDVCDYCKSAYSKLDKIIHKFLIVYIIIFLFVACIFYIHDLSCIYTKNDLIKLKRYYFDNQVYSIDILFHYLTIQPIISALFWPISLPAYLLELSRNELCR